MPSKTTRELRTIKHMASQSVGVLRGLARSENDISHDLDLEIKKKDHVPQTKWQKFRVKGQHCLHGKYVLMLVVALCILDCCLVITELILDIHAVKDALDIQHKADTQAHDTDFHESASNLTGTDPSNYHVTDRSPEVTHSVHRRAASGGGHALPITMEIAHGCHFASVAILGVLLVYVIFKVIFFGREMFGKKLEMFDAFVVLASFALDLAFLDGLTNGPIENTAFILSFFVPWRVLRVVNSLVVAILDHEHYKLVLIYKSKKRVEQTLDEVREELHEATNRVKKLKEVALQNGVNQWKINLAMVQASKHDGKKHALSSFASFTFGAMADKKSKEGKTSSVFSNAKPIKVPQLHEVEEGGNEKPDKVTIDGPSEPRRKERADTETSELEHTKSISGDSAVSLSLDAEQSGSTCSEVTEPAKNKDEEKDVGTEQNKTEKYVTVVKIPENEETGIEPKPDHSAVQISFDNPVNEDPEQLRRDNKALNSADRTISDADIEQLGYDNAAFVPDSSSTKL